MTTEEEELEETREALERIRERVAECLAIVDELFPEDEDKRKAESTQPKMTMAEWQARQRGAIRDRLEG